MVHQQVDQHGSAPYQAHIVFPIGVLKMSVERFDGGVTELYPHAHGCILLLSYAEIVL
jgi:hypothetical protein